MPANELNLKNNELINKLNSPTLSLDFKEEICHFIKSK